MKNIIVVSHKHLPQPDDDLVSYLNMSRGNRVMHIRHSFSEVADRCSYYSLYFKDRVVKESRTIDYSFLPEVLIYAKEFIATLKWVISSGFKWDYYIAVDGLCSFFGIILKRLGLCKKIIYWSIDFVPFNRFSAGWKNSVYRMVNSFVCRQVDIVWDLSPRMKEGRKKNWGVKDSDYKEHRLVPYGMWINRIKKVSYANCQKNTLVFMGHLMPKQGVDMVIKRISEIVKAVPDFKFKIIGGGGYQRNLERLAKDLYVYKYCDFLGKIKDNRDLEKEIAKSAVAIAPYLKLPDSYTYFADPGKVKSYLACGLPVLLTDVPWNAGEIEKNGCGMIISDKGDDLVERIVQTFNPSNNQKMRGKAIKYSNGFDYEKIFKSLDIFS